MKEAVMKYSLIIIALLFHTIPAQEFISSNLPIVVINTMGQEIVDEPDIVAKMGVIYNGPDQINNVTDPLNNYNGYVNIEYRGQSSQEPDKKPFGAETADSLGNDIDASILGFPEEEDWILNNVYFDKTFLRNVLTFKLWGEMGHTSVRTKMCEVVLNEEHQGVYVFMEKIKRDKNRIDIAEMKDADTVGEQLTGGYVLQLNWPVEEDEFGNPAGFDSDYNSIGGEKLRFHYEYPKPRYIQPTQKKYIREYMRDFESALIAENFTNNKGKRYNDYTDFISFVDFFIINEFSKNTDGYRLSTFLYKDKDRTNGPGLLTMGPVWDFNFAWYSVDYSGSGDYKNWSYNFPNMEDEELMPFWWKELITDTLFINYLKSRWVDLRKNILSESYLHAYIDSMALVLEEPQKRNFELWDILGENLWDQPEPIPTTFAGEIAALKKWITDRGSWLDENMPGNITAIEGKHQKANIKKMGITVGDIVQIQIFDARGRMIKKLKKKSSVSCTSYRFMNSYRILPPETGEGFYFYTVIINDGTRIKGKMCKMAF